MMEQTRQSMTTSNRKETSLKPLYARAVVSSLSSGMVSPFMGAYAIKLGASSSEMGWFQSSSNLSNNVMQIFWGILSDKLKRRIPFIVFGGLIVSVLWVPMIFVTEAYQLIILLAIQALLGSMATPAWTALIGDLVPSANLGRENASITLWATVGGLMATLASGILMIFVGTTIHEMLFIPLLVATAFGILSSLVILYVKETKNSEKLSLRSYIGSDILHTFRQTAKNPEFVKYCYVNGVFEFFMSMAWPLIPRTQVDILGASMLHLALLSVVQSIVIIVFQGWAGRRVDTVGRKPLLVFFRFALVTVPLTYAFAPNIETVTAVSVFWGFCMAVGQITVTTYLLDIAGEEWRGSFVAVFNLVIGVTTFGGSLIGGYLSDYTIGMFGLIAGIQVVYMISLAGRVAGAALHLTLKETLKQNPAKT
ncbi:MAG: MFS transporter [Candidatus Bathyarchaeota archaeon]|nr:MFS transporter [Candidatus Bathyarchaeota archaeon]